MTEDRNGAAVAEREGVICPECGELFPSERSLGMHRRAHRREERQQERAAGPQRARLDAKPTVDLGEEQGRLIESLTVLAGFALPIFPHVALTILTRADHHERLIPVPGQEPKPVARKGIAEVVMEQARRNPRILRGVVLFNNFMHAGEAIELAMELGAAVAVDAHLVDPHIRLPMPGVPDGAPIIEGLIGDVVEQVEMSFGNAPEQPAYAGPEEEGAAV